MRAAGEPSSSRHNRRRALDLATIAAIGAAGIAIGVAIGATGIGGVLLVPALIYLLGLAPAAAIAAALWSYLWSGLVAVRLYGRRGSIPWRAAAWLCLAALPGAYFGARTVAVLPATALQALIALLLLLSGANALRPEQRRDGAPRRLGPAPLLALGASTGFGSALIGAGGAVILVPLLVALGEAVLPAVGLGQAIQIPIAAVASFENWRAARLDLILGSGLAFALAIGIAAGTPLAHALPQSALRRLLAVTMLVAGIAILARLGLGAAHAAGLLGPASG